jgi:hypothetical protein
MQLFGIGTSSPHVAREAGALRELPVEAAWAGLLVTCAGCVWLLDRRLRAREVVG